MSRFDRYMLSQLMMFFGFFALVLVSIYWVNSAVRLFDRLIADGQSVWVFLEMSALSLPNVVRLMVPVAAFVAVVYTVTRMAGESELVVMQATGFSPFRLARPVLYFGLIVAGLLSILTHVLVPASRVRLNGWNEEISRNASSKFLNEGTFLHPTEGVTLYMRDISLAGELRDLFLSDARQGGTVTTYTAERAYLVKSGDVPKLVMLDGMAQSLRRSDRQLSVTRFENFTYDIGALIARRGPHVPTVEERPTPELLAADRAELKAAGIAPNAARAEAHDRFAKPLIAIAASLLAFAAMMTGGYSRLGQWPQTALAVGLFVLLFLLSNIAGQAAARGAVAALYLPGLAGLGLALALLGWVGRVRRRPRLAGAVA